MAKARGRDIHRSLSERVARAVAGQGIPRRTVDAAVSRVVAALDGAAAADASPRGRPAADAGPVGDSLLVAFTTTTAPDLASRVRAALAALHVTPRELGTASAGRHTVVTARVPASARGAVATVGETLALSVSVLDAPGEGR